MNDLISNVMRLAVITDIDYESGIAYIRFVDQDIDDRREISIPHPYPGNGGEGVFVGAKKGTMVVLGMLSYERYVPVTTIPMPGLYGDLDEISETHFDDVGSPDLSSGDVVIQGISGGQLRFDNDGIISLKNRFDEGILYSGEDNESIRCSIEIAQPTQYVVSNTGLYASGTIRRDIRINEDDEIFSDFLTNIESEQILEEVGRDVTKQTTYMSRSPTSEGASKTDDKYLRNPAFVEDRKLIFEFGRNWEVGNFETELKNLDEGIQNINNPEERREHRSNVLSLSLSHPNELIEEVDGTLVDIFGNLLTINKSILPDPNGKNNKELLENIFEISRHTVAHHIEINTRKGLEYRGAGSSALLKPILLNGTPSVHTTENNARDRSRWAMRVDKEGLTTINIPATSETGNIPLLTRQETSSQLNIDEKGNVIKKTGNRNDENSSFIYRNTEQQDIFHDQFGPGGIRIKDPQDQKTKNFPYNQIKNRLDGYKSSWEDSTNKQTTLPKYVESGTAFHNITKTALTILQENINKNASDVFTDRVTTNDSYAAMRNEINSNLPITDISAPNRDGYGLLKGYPNAGGRSVQLNLDGNLETSIGANTLDRVSWVLDTAGALVARLGRDRFGRSAIIQADGYVVLEVGGFDFIGETPDDKTDLRFTGGGWGRGDALPGDPFRFRSGKVVIRLRRANPQQTGPDTEDTVLILDETGVTVQTAGRLNFVSKLDMILKSDSRILFEAPNVQMYKENSRFVTRNGRRI